ncbi:MAG: DUF1330 domain-containing protein [Candidatus Hydrogenedentes bacterium]|nr:DUF1330 domain-containing protein [Candidatus Hydrogenedentota bacterium]
MAAYVIIQVNVTDAEKYEAYKKLTPASVERYGGRFLVRGGAQVDLEGVLEYSRIVLLEFPDVDRAKQWYDSPEYEESKALRAGASTGIFTVVQGAEG